MATSDTPTPFVAVLACSDTDRDALIRSIEDLADAFGGEVRRETDSSACTAIIAHVPTDTAPRFTAALLLAGATILPETAGIPGAITILVSTQPPVQDWS